MATMGMLRGLFLLLLLANGSSNPMSKPFIAYRTSPFDQGETLDHTLDWDDETVQEHRSQIHPHDTVDATQCPLQFSLGISKRLHTARHGGASHGAENAIRQPPIIYPVFPARGPGRQVIYNTQYEHLDLLSPAPLETQGQAIKEALLQAADFPLLLESSSFLSSPILHDVNGDGITDAILTDYDGGLYIVGLGGKSRYFQHTQVPRLYIRREWLERRVNDTLYGTPTTDEDADKKDHTQPDDPYHTFFEYYYAGQNEKEKVLRGVTANLIGQDHDELKALSERRNRRVQHDSRKPGDESGDESNSSQESMEESLEEGSLEESLVEEESLEEPSKKESLEESSKKESLEEPSKKGETSRRRLQEAEGESREAAQETQSAGEQESQEHIPQDQVREESVPETPPEEETHSDAKTEEHMEQVTEQVPEAQVEEQVYTEGVKDQVEHGAQNEVQEEEALSETQEQQELEISNEEAIPSEQVEEHQIDQEVKQEEVNVDATDHEAIVETVEGAAQNPIKPDETVKEEHSEETEESIEDFSTGVQAKQERKLDEPITRKDREEFSLDENANESRDPNPNRDIDGAYPREDNFAADDPEYARGGYDDEYAPREDDFAADDPEYARGGFDDEYDYDDTFGHHDRGANDYYDEKHYIRVPPHILCSPVLAELPKLYGESAEFDDVLFVAVSYYLDEDEYQGLFSYKRFEETDHGDETEVKRGSYVSSAIMAYTLGDSSRWSGQTHLDLSTDFSSPENVTIVGSLPIHADVSKMGAFALGSPTVADLDGDGSLEVLLGTSMGIVYAFDARQMFKRDNWPIQMKHPIESRIIVEDAVGDTNLEVFVADIGGNVVCFSFEAHQIWYRDLLHSLNQEASALVGSSGMTLGDVDNDGVLDLVLLIRTKDKSNTERSFVFALNAATGQDLPNFPIELDLVKLKRSGESSGIHEKLAQPLLVDLHADISFLDDYLRRNGTQWEKRPTRNLASPPHGGSSSGLHIVQPLGEHVYIIEAGSGCTQKVSIGAEVSSMVAVDDVHGTNKLDLVVVTEAGNTITLESSSPYHPLNTWNHGEIRGRTNSHAHGYSASQGIFVHEVSRQYVDIFGVYVPITFEIFDNRRNIQHEPGRRMYNVDIRDGTSSKRMLWRKDYTEAGVYTERVYIRYGPGYYSLSVVMKTSHGLIYEDTFHIGYNVHFMDGFGSLLVIPLLVASVTILLCGAKKASWDDEEFDETNSRGILDQELPA
jgi:hypothetical protein